MIPIISDLISNTVGKVVNGVVNKYLPTSMGEKEKAEMQLEINKLMIEEEKVLQSQMETINQTMREEAKSDKFIVYSWRPLVGYCFITLILNNFVLLPYFASYGLQPIVIPDGIWTAMLIVLVISAGTRGYEKITKAGK